MRREARKLGWKGQGGRVRARAHSGLAAIVLGLVLLLAWGVPCGPALAADPSPDAEVEASLDASSARYTALAAYYGAKKVDVERSVAASSARWAAQGADYMARIEAAAAASSARYTALAAYYAARAGGR